MRIYKEINIADFEAWSGGRDTLEKIIEAGKAADLEALLEETEPAEGWSETAVNDVLWFEDKWLFDSLGIDPNETDDEDETDDEESEAE